MTGNLRVGCTLDAFVAEGATVVWTDAMAGLKADFAQNVGVLALHERISRDGTSQSILDSASYARFLGQDISVESLDRSDEGLGEQTEYSEHDIERVAAFVQKSDILTTLEEYPLGVIRELGNDTLPPVVVNLFRSGEFKPEKCVYNLLEGLRNGTIAKVTVDADSSRDSYIRRGVPSDSITVIHNGIDIVRFVPSDAERGRVRRELSIPDDAPTILFVGRDSPEKDVPLFVQSARHFLTKQPNAHVIMAGAGLSRDNPNIAKLLADEAIDENGELAKRLHALGSRPDIAAFHAAADVLAITSATESRPLTINEAQAAGLGVAVSTNVGDSASMIDRHGFITGRDPQEIAERWQEAYARREELKFPIDQRDSLGTKRMVSEYNRVLQEIAS